MHVIDWLEAQNEDPVIRGAIEWMQLGKEKSLKHHLGALASSSEGLGFISRQKSLVLVNSKFYLKCKLKGEAETTVVFIIPKAHRRKAINGCHRDAGHQGQNRTTSLLLEQFWWPGMMLEVKSAVKNCKQCLCHDGDSVRAPLVPIEATGPMDLLHLGFTKIEVSGDCKKELKKPEVVNVLVVTDHFTQHTMAFVTEDMTTHTMACVLYHHYFYIFGTPLRLMTDNDLAFTSEVVQELCNLFGVKRVCTSAYHPQSNGAIERQHQMVIKMIGRLSHDEKANWPKHLPELIQAYNGMRSAIMGYSLHYLLFGYRLRFPIDLHFPTIRKRHMVRVDDFVVMLQQCLSKALNEARRQNVLEVC